MVTPPASSPSANPAEPGERLASPEPGDTSQKTFEGTAGIVEKKRSGTKLAVLREVRTGKHENFDRVVFEFEGNAIPGYHVEYVDKPIRDCGAGEVVPLVGDVFLRIQMQPAQAHTEAGVPTVMARQQTPNLPLIKEMKLTCDFEALVEWVLGVSAPNHYRVLELQNPARLVIDVAHKASGA